MSSDDEQANVVTSSNKLSVSPGGSSTESNNTSILGSSKGKRKHSATETEVSSDSTNSVKTYEKFKKKELLTSESSDCTVFSHSGSESPIALEEIPSRTSDWNEQVLPLLNIKVDLSVYEPHDLFNSGYVNFFMRKHHTKISGFIGYQARNAEQLHLLKQCLTLAFTDSVKVDCSVIEEIPLHKVIEMENELKCPEWTQNLLKNLGKFDSKHESTMIDFSHSLRVWLKQFVQQISLMVQKRKRSKPEEITEGMFQELFILFVKMFGTQISGYSNLQPFFIHLGEQTVSSIPDAIIYSPSCRDIENENSIAVIEIKKEYSKCESEETERELRSIRKKSKTDHIPSKLKGQHVGEMLALLPSSVFGTHGIYGFLVQGTKSKSDMKKVAVFGVYAVGMHHWGGTELRVGEVYYARNEPLNPKDKHAIAVFADTDCSHKRAYLSRKDALHVSRLFAENLIYDKCYVKPKGATEKFNRKCGPLKRCNIGFFTADENIVQVREVLDKYELKIW